MRTPALALLIPRACSGFARDAHCSFGRGRLFHLSADGVRWTHKLVRTVMRRTPLERAMGAQSVIGLLCIGAAAVPAALAAAVGHAGDAAKANRVVQAPALGGA